MSKKNLSPKQIEGTEPVQKLIPIGQNVPAGGIEIQKVKTEMDNLAAKGVPGVSKIHKDNGRPPVKIDLRELKQLEAKGNGGSTSMNTGDSKTPIPTKIDPKGTVDKTYKIQPENINTKKK